MRPISLARFNALAGYVRQPHTLYTAEEILWFEHGDERVLGTVIRDRTDGDYGGVVLGRDRRGCFRAVALSSFDPSPHRAKALLRREMEQLSMASNGEYYQGDETGVPLNFFSNTKKKKDLNPDFLKLTEDEGYSPARGIIEPMMQWYDDPDGNFIEQFQTTGFSPRLWELYLFATFTEMGYSISRVHAVPDFVCDGIPGEFAVEAMTVNPTQDRTGAIVPPPQCETEEDFFSFLREYMPIKWGSTLTSKLSKKYWEKPSAAGKPLLFAIQDFFDLGSMRYTSTSLPIYLYGYDHDWIHDDEGKLVITPRKIVSHRWGEKEIPSGFFDLPEVENVSAVLFNSSATISKFNRMGLLAGFGSSRVVLIRDGQAYKHDQNAAAPHGFMQLVNSPAYKETWVEGLDVFHNPNAKYPISPGMLPGASHHWLLPDGQIESHIPDWHPFGSLTHIMIIKED